MALATAYTSTPQRRPVNALVISHFDGHGVATAAARARILRNRGEEVAIVSKFPESGPQGLSSGALKSLVEGFAPQRIEMIDMPIDVRNPDAAIKTLSELVIVAPIHYYDHHETDKPFIPRLIAAGVIPVIADTGLSLAIALELLNDDVAKELAVIGMVADRDRSVTKIVPRDEIERVYLPLANALDMAVRNPRVVGGATAGDVAEMLASNGIAAIPRTVDYPPEMLARQLTSRIVEEGQIAVLVDWADQQPTETMWTPKTLEQLMILRGKSIAVAVVPGYNPRTKATEGYDVRVVKYWLAGCGMPTPEDVAKDLIAQAAIRGSVVGHADYVSIRFSSVEEARSAAMLIYRRIEGSESSAAHLISDNFVAAAIKRDFRMILERLAEILETQSKMYQEYLSLKKRQVELLERSTNNETARYD